MLRFIVIHFAVVVLVGLYSLHAELSTKQAPQDPWILFNSTFTKTGEKALKEEKAVARGKRVSRKMRSEGDAFNNDFRGCMLGQWEIDGILDTLPAELCSYKSWFWADYYSRLCYALKAKRNTAQFISCYNTKALIPEFTAHIVPAGKKFPNEPTYERPKWRQDKGPNAPEKQAFTGDFGSRQQTTDNPSWNDKDYYCNRGHLTPIGDFHTKAEKDLTMIVTNAAPQWKKFNGNNWARMEEAVKDWATANNTQLYVFTGTAEKAAYSSWSNWWPSWFRPLYKLNKKVIIPKYFWKVVCEPTTSRESIVFVAENNVGEQRNDIKLPGCLGIQMAKDEGIVRCYSLDDAKNKFPELPFPPFNENRCGTKNLGKFLDIYLKQRLNKQN